MMLIFHLVRKGTERVIDELTHSSPMDSKVIKTWESWKKQCEVLSIASGVTFATSLIWILKKDASPMSRKACSLMALASLVFFAVSAILGGRCGEKIKSLNLRQQLVMSLGKYLQSQDDVIDQYANEISQLVPELDRELLRANMQETKQATNNGFISLDFSSEHRKILKMKQAIGLNDLQEDQWDGSYNICDFYASKILQNHLKGNIVAAFEQKMAVIFLAKQFRVKNEHLKLLKTEIEKLDPKDVDRAIFLGVVEKLLSPQLPGPAKLGAQGGEVVKAV